LPVYNQADHIGSVIQEYQSGLDQMPLNYELLLIVNGRQFDNSLEICQEFARRFPQIKVFTLERGGWGRAVRYGLSQASGDLLCFTNSARTTLSDLQLALLFGSIHPNCVVKANRKIRSGSGRRLGSLLYNLECRALFDLPYWDINGTPKVFPRRFSALSQLSREDDLIDLEFNLICRRNNIQVLELPIFSSSRRSGQSTTSWRSALHMYLGAWSLYRERRLP
jgi:glycosyltransferase involved in cell wall biosynthesis